MRDYNRRKGKYILPIAVFHQVLWQVRDYYRMKAEADAILEESAPPPDGMPHGDPSPDGVFNKATKRIEMMYYVDLIDSELEKIPAEYRRGVWNNIQYRQAFPNDAGRATYSRYKQYFLYRLAERQNLI